MERLLSWGSMPLHTHYALFILSYFVGYQSSRPKANYGFSFSLDTQTGHVVSSLLRASADAALNRYSDEIATEVCDAAYCKIIQIDLLLKRQRKRKLLS